MLFPRLETIASRTAIFHGGLLLTGAAIALCAFAESGSGLLLYVVCAGALLGAGNPLERTVLHERVPGNIAGQAFTAHTALRFAAGPLGLLLAGLAVELANVKAVLLTGGGLLLFTAALGVPLAPLPGRTVSRGS